MVKCTACVYGKYPRLNCGRVALTSFYDPIDGTRVFTCKLHVKGYRKNPVTWKEKPIEEPNILKEEK